MLACSCLPVVKLIYVLMSPSECMSKKSSANQWNFFLCSFTYPLCFYHITSDYILNISSNEYNENHHHHYMVIHIEYVHFYSFSHDFLSTYSMSYNNLCMVIYSL